MTHRDEAEERARVIAEAKTWLGTPFRHQQDKKGAGVDCAMLLVRVYAHVGVIPKDFDPRPYSEQWFLHRDEERFLGFVRQLGAEVERPPLPGDVLVYRFGRCFAHGAIVIDEGHVLHAWKMLGKVVISEMNDIALTQSPCGARVPRKTFDCWARPS